MIDEEFADVVPGTRVLRVWGLDGGVSAVVTAVEVESGGSRRTVVVRDYGEANLRADPRVARHEYELLRFLHAGGVPVPAPVRVPHAGRLVIEFIDGVSGEGVSEAGQMAGALATALARIHALDPTGRPLFLADQADTAAQRLAEAPAHPDETLRESQVRAALADLWPPVERNPPVLLHGDMWPGNTLWRDGKLVAVIDWEDSAVGDPLADVGNVRFELCLAYGPDAANEFTDRYRALVPDLDDTALPVWDLYAALRPAGKVAGWGLDDTELTEFQTAHARFVETALSAAT